MEFDSTITSSFSLDERPAVILDKSYFYPTSGGQEHDTGSINGTEVVDVVERDGEVVHLLASPLEPASVHCIIDRERRLENMQQHTGQHILSAAFENLFDISTVSSRLGGPAGTIDLSREPDPGEVAAAVARANEIVREDREVKIHFADNDTIGSFKLRKPPKVDGIVRIVEVRDFDFSPCGGTHCTHTSEIGVIVTGDIEKVKSSLTRIEFFCGQRAMRYFYMISDSLRESSRILSAQKSEVPGSIRRLKDQLQARDSRLKEVSERFMKSLCHELKDRLSAAEDDVILVDLGTEVGNTDELRFVSSCVSRELKKPFAFYRTEGNICQMNLSLSLEAQKDAALMERLRTGFAVKGGGRNGFFTITFDSSNLPRISDFLKESISNG